MSTFTVTKQWHQNTSKAGKVETLAADVTIELAEKALLDEMDRQDTCMIDREKKEVHCGDYTPSLLWESGDGSLRFGDFTINIEKQS